MFEVGYWFCFLYRIRRSEFDDTEVNDAYATLTIFLGVDAATDTDHDPFLKIKIILRYFKDICHPYSTGFLHQAT